MILTSPFTIQKGGKKEVEYYDFVVKKKHSSIRNVFDKEDLKPPIVTLEKNYSLFS